MGMDRPLHRGARGHYEAGQANRDSADPQELQNDGLRAPSGPVAIAYVNS